MAQENGLSGGEKITRQVEIYVDNLKLQIRWKWERRQAYPLAHNFWWMRKLIHPTKAGSSCSKLG